MKSPVARSWVSSPGPCTVTGVSLGKTSIPAGWSSGLRGLKTPEARSGKTFAQRVAPLRFRSDYHICRLSLAIVRRRPLYVCVGRNRAMMLVSKFTVEFYRQFAAELVNPKKDWYVSGGWVSKQSRMDISVGQCA
ncbi:hypothetical protein F4777DRAFT_467098 [Nemania sp. FL0916]|nr:hypothetical protein F4777DRAFT_467098 [Nemania sp. FL0916]